jgi:hypothetical protein
MFVLSWSSGFSKNKTPLVSAGKAAHAHTHTHTHTHILVYTDTYVHTYIHTAEAYIHSRSIRTEIRNSCTYTTHQC